MGKYTVILSIVLVLTIIIGTCFIVNNHFEKKIKFRAFEECLSAVSDTASNWISRKETINYCRKETF